MSRESRPSHEAILEAWIAATNTHDAEKYLSFFTDDAVLNDPSVGRRFRGKAELGEYFDAYFVGYDTRTRLMRVERRDGYVHVEVHFTGSFPGGEIAGIFDVTFDGEQISLVHADLLE